MRVFSFISLICFCAISCGKDNKSEPKDTELYHYFFTAKEGVCIEMSYDANRADLLPGKCPNTMQVNFETVRKFAKCKHQNDDDKNLATVHYEKYYYPRFGTTKIVKERTQEEVCGNSLVVED